MTVAVRQAASASVLVVEDDPGFAEVVRRCLSGNGYQTVLAGRGDRALECIARGEHDLVILDLVLPDIDGVTLLARILETDPDMRVIVVSALSSVEAKVRCLDLGAADYIAKPFALDELAARVRARVRAGKADQPERVIGGASLSLDLQRRIAVVQGRAVSLSTREFFLLEYLMRHSDQVCSRKELLEHVWGYTFDPGTNVVDVYVRRVRNKLGPRHIETIRNVGYSLVRA